MQVTELARGSEVATHQGLTDFRERNRSGRGTFCRPPQAGRWTGDQTARTDNGALSRRVGGPTAHPYAVTASPTPPAACPFQAEGILTGRGHLHSGLAEGDIGSHCSRRFPAAAGAWAGALGGAGTGCGRAGQTKERDTDREAAAGGEILTVGENIGVRWGVAAAEFVCPGTATTPHFGHPCRV